MSRMNKAIFGTTAVLLVGSGVVTQAWSKPRHRTDRANALRPTVTRSLIRDQDVSIPAGFVDVSRDSSGTEHSQGMIAVSPTSNTLLASLFYDSRSAFTVQTSYSQDGGNTWALSAMPTSIPTGVSADTGLSDPTITVDSLGRFFAGGSGPNPIRVGQTLSTFVFRSDDGGASFAALNPPSAAFTLKAQQDTDFLDHQSNYADSSGTTSNDYVTASQIATIDKQDDQSQVVIFNSSADGGASWTYPTTTGLQVNDNAPNAYEGNATPDTRVDSNGKVFVDWTQITSSDQVYITLDKADIPNGGSFGTDVHVSPALSTNPNFFTGYLGDIRAGVFNAFAIDTGTTSTNGNVYECWTDQVTTLGDTFKLFVARSQDGGSTFSTPIRVDSSMDAAGTLSDHQTIPTIAVNPQTGQVVLTYYSSHLNPSSRGGPNTSVTINETPANTPLVDLLVAIGTPNSSGGLDFAGPYRVTQNSIDVLAADNAGFLQFDPVLGDYNGLAFRSVTDGINSVLELATTDSDNHVVEIANQQFDASATLNGSSGGTFEFVATATAPVAGLTATINWGDGTSSTGLDVTHNYAAGAATATATVSDGSTSTRTFTFDVTSTGVFTNGAAAATSSVVTNNTLVALTSASTGSTTSGTTTGGTSGTTTGGTSGTTGGTTTAATTTTASTTGGTGTTATTTGGTSTAGTTTGTTSSGGGACFIATAAYGSYWEPHVLTLRRFRDQDLLTNAPGRVFVQNYYHYSPPIADWIREHEWARAAVRTGLSPMVFALEHTYLAFLGTIGGLFAGFGLLGYRRRLQAEALEPGIANS